MGGIINQVAQYKNYKNAIGFTFRFYSTEMVRNNQIKLLEIDGIEPTKETIRNGEYLISSEFYIVTAGTKNQRGEIDRLGAFATRSTINGKSWLCVCREKLILLAHS